MVKTISLRFFRAMMENGARGAHGAHIGVTTEGRFPSWFEERLTPDVVVAYKTDQAGAKLSPQQS